MQRNSEEVLCGKRTKLLNSNTHADKRTCQQREDEINRRHVSATSRTHLHSRCTPPTGETKKNKISSTQAEFKKWKNELRGLTRNQQVSSVVQPDSRQRHSYCDSPSQISFKTTGNKPQHCIFYSLMTRDDGWKVGSWACTWVMRQRRDLPAASRL